MALFDTIEKTISKKPAPALHLPKPEAAPAPQKAYTQRTPAIETERVVSAESFLAGLESNRQLSAVDVGMPFADLHRALEETIPTEEPPYDPTEDLEDVANALAGLSADDGIDPDMPNPESDISNDMTVNNLATTPSGATEGLISKLKNRKVHPSPSDYPRAGSVKAMVANNLETAIVANVPLWLDPEDLGEITDVDIKKIQEYVNMAGMIQKELSVKLLAAVMNEDDPNHPWITSGMEKHGRNYTTAKDIERDLKLIDMRVYRFDPEKHPYPGIELSYEIGLDEHIIVVDNAVSVNDGRYKRDFTYSISG